MKLKEGYMLREVVGSWIVVPIGQRVIEFNGLMTLSESGALLWKELETGTSIDEMGALILREYSIDQVTAEADVQEFIDSLQEKGLIE